MLPALPLACFLSVLRPPGVQYEDAVLQLAPLDKAHCPYIKDGSDVGFQLFTKHNPTAYQELRLGDDELLFASNVDFHAPTVLYFHAFMEQPSDGSGLMVREAYMQRGSVNLIMVDAHRLEAGPWYFTAAQNTWYVGQFAARFIDYLVSRGLNLNNTQLVGHSLGAQAAGVAGSAIQSGRVARITGLDPALPLFAGLPLAQRLDPSDAQFVDVIHTDAGIFGVKEPVGHVDFYPNGGLSPQPGCELEVVIPKRLLLNKCDGTEQTNGFYTYYLTSNQHVNEYSEYPTSNGINVDKTASERIEPDTSEHEIGTENSKYVRTQKHIENFVKSNSKTPKIIKKYHHSDMEINTVSNYLLAHKERVQRNARETVTNDILMKGIQHLPIIQALGHTALNDDKINTAHETITNMAVKNNAAIVNEDKTSNNDNQTKENILNTLLKIDNEITLTKTPQKSTIQSNEPKIREKRFLNIFKSDKKDTGFLNIFKSEKKETNENFIVKAFKFLSRKVTQSNKLKSRQKRFLNISKSEKKDTNENFFIKAFKFLSTKVTQSNKPKSRQKRFLNIFKSNNNDANENFISKTFRFLSRKVVPVITVVREINTLVKSANGELNQMTKERNEYVGANPPPFKPIAFSLELGTDKGVVAFLKKLLGLGAKGDKLTIGCQ